MNAKETFTIATIPMERVLTQRARLIVHVNLGLREMEQIYAKVKKHLVISKTSYYHSFKILLRF